MSNFTDYLKDVSNRVFSFADNFYDFEVTAQKDIGILNSKVKPLYNVELSDVFFNYGTEVRDIYDHVKNSFGRAKTKLEDAVNSLYKRYSNNKTDDPTQDFISKQLDVHDEKCYYREGIDKIVKTSEGSIHEIAVILSGKKGWKWSKRLDLLEKYLTSNHNKKNLSQIIEAVNSNGYLNKFHKDKASRINDLLSSYSL